MKEGNHQSNIETDTLKKNKKQKKNIETSLCVRKGHTGRRRGATSGNIVTSSPYIRTGACFA